MLLSESKDPHATRINQLERARKAAEERAAAAELSVSQMNSKLAAQVCPRCAPETIDLVEDNAPAAPPESAKRKAAVVGLVHESRKRLAVVKQEKQAAIEDAEDQEETTQMTALILDRWQSYADELKKQISSLGAEPLRWDGRGVPPEFGNHW